MNIKKLSLGAVLVTLLMTLLSLVSPTSSVKAETKKYVIATDITFAPFVSWYSNGEYSSLIQYQFRRIHHLNTKIQMVNTSELILN